MAAEAEAENQTLQLTSMVQISCLPYLSCVALNKSFPMPSPTPVWFEPTTHTFLGWPGN